MAQNYECVLLLKPTLTDEIVQGYLDQFSKIITDNQAELLHVQRSKKRKLEYEIAGHREAIFAIFYFRTAKGAGAIIQELERQVRIVEDMMREMTVKVPELRIIDIVRLETVPPTREEYRRSRYAAAQATVTASIEPKQAEEPAQPAEAADEPQTDETPAAPAEEPAAQ